MVKIKHHGQVWLLVKFSIYQFIMCFQSSLLFGEGKRQRKKEIGKVRESIKEAIKTILMHIFCTDPVFLFCLIVLLSSVLFSIRS